jgi:hypothetical protein
LSQFADVAPKAEVLAKDYQGRAVREIEVGLGIGVSGEKVSEIENCWEFQVLQSKFSSGVTLKELRSVAVVISLMGGLAQPNRFQKRSYCAMVDWYRKNWDVAWSYLRWIQLRDENDVPIDGVREVKDKHLR